MISRHRAFTENVAVVERKDSKFHQSLTPRERLIIERILLMLREHRAAGRNVFTLQVEVKGREITWRHIQVHAGTVVCDAELE